jgi:hypothetical protein
MFCGAWFLVVIDQLYFCLLVTYYLNLLLQTKLYTEDWIGLRALDEAGRVHFISVPGPHLGLSEADMKKHVIPYLNGQTS